jgi:predicted TIM-barrel fold metal-dependent hydrolase
MAEFKIISADSHIEEPEELWKGLPGKYLAKAPHIVEKDGGTYMIHDGRPPVRLDLLEERLTEEDKRREFRNDQSGGADISLRLADLALDGISAEVIYPNSIFHIYVSPDPGYQLAAASMYNDWQMEIFSEYPDVFIPAAIIPMIDIPAAIKEAQRVVSNGYRSLSVPVVMPELPYDRPAYEPFWAAVEELGAPLNFHVFTGQNAILDGLGEEEGRGQDLTQVALGMAEAMSPLTMLIGSGALQRHPKLKFVLVECGIGWLAWILYALDEMSGKRHMWQRPILELKPSEFFKRQGYATFGEDPVGLRNRDYTGVECLMWGSDYPHDEGTFPHSQEVIADTFRGVPKEETALMVGGNAARLYGFMPE